MIIDKRKNLKTLFNLGTTVKQIKKIFIYHGFLLTFTGMSIGLIMGILLIFIQKKWGLFMITQDLPYPVEFRWLNLLVVFLTITILGYIASLIASKSITKEFIKK